jgi:ribosomal 30S subunit maturation factor RimM
VSDVLLLPSADTLEVERPGGESLLVPLVEDAVRSVDTAGARIDVDMGFLEGPR